MASLTPNITLIPGHVSRAKKGVPVHTCDLCKPPKTFTRAEHLRRHQLSHKEPGFPCTIAGCGKAFHRSDLLERHMQRHNSEDTEKKIEDHTPLTPVPVDKEFNSGEGGYFDSEELTHDLGDKKTTHKYSTLSRDQTSASTWKVELLQVLRTVKPTNSQGTRQGKLNLREFLRTPSQPPALEFVNPFYNEISTRPYSYVRDLDPKETSVDENLHFTPAFTSTTTGEIEGEAMNPILPSGGHGGSMNGEGYLNHLRTQVEYLERELQKHASDVTPKQDKRTESHPSFKTLYVIERDGADINIRGHPSVYIPSQHVTSGQPRPQMAYLDEPTWLVGPNQEFMLTAHFPITDLDGYLEHNNTASFAVVKIYNPNQQALELQRAHREKKALPRPKPSREYIRLISQDMIAAAENFFGKQPRFKTDFPNFKVRKPIDSPYLCWYFYRSNNDFSGMPPCHQRDLQLLTNEIEKSCGDTYDLIDSQLKRRVVSIETIQFLFRPGDILLSKEGVKQDAYVASSRATQQTPSRKSDDWMRRSGNNDIQMSYTWDIDAWSYQYDGRFYEARRTGDSSLKLQLNVSHYEEEVPMSHLNVLPLVYADKASAELLSRRGRTFWSCRHKKLVSYQEKLDQFTSGNGDRYMVDFLTYRQLHSDSPFFTKKYLSNNPQSRNYMSEEAMSSNIPPSEPEIYLFPDTIPGFNLRTKKWVDLDVDHIKNVKWNKKAFENLVVDRETKELIQALVTNQSETDHDADLIENKGNGLIMLLHGGPGTGKTFTAETVAEMAEKPLFRVTCGDIGTKPENVEAYLESALNLGKIWKCVVLLDEADVFLEQRTLTDLERNALVSVFLRVLEYYEGILILTSNRVGTFDEAFKSRIQLSLHYENLKRDQRRQIWKNFLNRLSSLQEERASSALASPCATQTSELSKKEDFGIDFDDINDYLKELSDYELNGRQIRNAITTARQLAKFKKETMSYAHLKHVIGVASKFDAYLGNLTGYSGDDMARENGIRF